jgi:hypothetical protein
MKIKTRSFDLGTILITLSNHKMPNDDDMQVALLRHSSCDWGD